MKLTPCGCGISYLVRLNRSFWMRWVPGRRHYFCVCCKSHQLLSRVHLRRMFPTMAPELDRDVTAPGALEPLEFPVRSTAASGPRSRQRVPARMGPLRRT
jgi:hypothetical protein